MSIHNTTFGALGRDLPADIHGFVPTDEDGPFDLEYDHGTESTHDSDENLTEYGEWWEGDKWPELKAEAAAAIAEAEPSPIAEAERALAD